jgi:hypothetical protein
MITYTCDGCGAKLDKTDLRYTVKIEAHAAYDEMEVGLTELVRDHRQEMIELIEQMRHKPTREIEESIYKHAHLDLCPRCYRAFVRDPLHFHPEQVPSLPDIDIDGFLRSLGYGKTKDHEPGE